MSVAKRTSISINPIVLAKGLERVQALGYSSFSEYIAFLIERDHLEHPEHVTVRTAGRPAQSRFTLEEPALTAEKGTGYTTPVNPTKAGTPERAAHLAAIAEDFATRRKLARDKPPQTAPDQQPSPPARVPHQEAKTKSQ